MGVDISSIIQGRTISLRDISGKVISIDAFNSLYQFLSIIRLPDGNPLRNRDGEVTSHLSGLFYRNLNFLEAGIKPIYVFDGEPPELKRETIEKRAAARRDAEVAWKEALAVGDMEVAWTKATRASRLTGTMIEDSKRLLEYMGIPWLQSASEGEAQASHLVRKGIAHAAASQDFDSLLFGCPLLIRNLAISGRRRHPRSKQYINIEPEEVSLELTLNSLGITREQLVDMGILIGTDYNPGIRGIGPKKALNLIQKYGGIEEASKENKIEPIDSLDKLREIFMEPEVEEPSKLVWEKVNRKAVISFMCDRNSFGVDRISSALDRITSATSAAPASSLDKWC